MPEFVNRSWGWFQARTGVQKAIIAVVVLLVLVVLSPVIAALAGLLFFVALVALVVQLIRRRSVRPWAIAAGGGLVLSLAFGGLSSALLSGPEVEDPPRIDRAEKPRPEKQQPKPPTDKEQASEPKKKSEDKPEKAPEKEKARNVVAPEYTVDEKIESGDLRTDWFIITDPSATDAELGAILEALNGEDAATTAVFFASEAKAQKNQSFAYGQYAANGLGMEFLDLNGEAPRAVIER